MMMKLLLQMKLLLTIKLLLQLLLLLLQQLLDLPFVLLANAAELVVELRCRLRPLAAAVPLPRLR